MSPLPAPGSLRPLPCGANTTATFLPDARHNRRADPGIEACVMTIRKIQLDCIVSYRLDVADTDLFLSSLQHFLPRTVTTHLCGGRVDAQELAWKLKGLAVAKRNFQYAGFSMQFYFGGARSIFAQTCHRYRSRNWKSANDKPAHAKPIPRRFQAI